MAPKENVDIAKERKSCSFDKRELTWLLDGGRDASERRKRMEEYILSQPGMYEGIGAYDFLSHEDRYTKSIEKGAKMLQLCLKADEVLGDGYQYEAMRMFNFPTLSGAVIPDGNPFNLHFVMFLTTLTGQGTLEQQTEWLGRAWNCEIIGTYAQTEIGHGTFLRGLETKAEYDPKTEEFVFNTPRLSATKWWPGSLGKTANYAIVPAHLYIHGVNYGMHTFIVQLRREEDHTSMPGITIGEIGPKYGMNSNDNGFLHLKNVRVPRKNMMMKHAQVLPDGTYVKPQNAKLSYGTMIFVRVVISQEVVMQLQKAVTIAVRYSAVRRQSKIEPEEAEVQVIDFVTQQFKLFPAIASVFAIHFAAAALWDDYLEVTASMGDGNLDRLPELHTNSCATKALSSSEGANWVDVLRRACGGHGYLMSSNLPKIFATVTASCTYEGENTVLWLQVARNIVKPEFLAEQKPSSLESVAKMSIISAKGILDVDVAVEAFRSITIGRVTEALDELECRKMAGMAPEVAWNSIAVRLVAAAESYARHFVVKTFVQGVERAQLSAGGARILQSLCRLYAAFWIRENSGDFLRYSGFDRTDLLEVDRCVEAELAIIRPEAVNIVDSFGLRDEIVNSALGCYDGNVYERLLETAKKSPLNQKDVPDAYQKYLKPLMNQAKL